jgi:MAP3K TRAFs-binding domain
VRTVERELNIPDADSAIIVELFLSYRSVKDWDIMVKLVQRMSPFSPATVMVREYPGVNAVTLMEMDDPVDARQAEISPQSAPTTGITPLELWVLATRLVEAGRLCPY